MCATGEAGGKKYGGMKEEGVAGRAKGACHEEEELQYSTYDSKGKITVSVLTKKCTTLTTNKPNTKSKHPLAHFRVYYFKRFD